MGMGMGMDMDMGQEQGKEVASRIGSVELQLTNT